APHPGAARCARPELRRASGLCRRAAPVQARRRLPRLPGQGVEGVEVLTQLSSPAECREAARGEGDPGGKHRDGGRHLGPLPFAMRPYAVATDDRSAGDDNLCLPLEAFQSAPISPFAAGRPPNLAGGADVCPKALDRRLGLAARRIPSRLAPGRESASGAFFESSTRATI